MEITQIAEKIRSLRELKNYTQEYMAQQLGITQAGYSKIEMGNTDIPFSRLTMIAKVLDVGVEDIVTFDSEKYFSNSFNNVKGNNNGYVVIKVEQSELKELYQDKINLLTKLLKNTENELQSYRDKFGDI